VRAGEQSGRVEAGEGLAIGQVNSESGFSGGEVQMFLMMEGLRRRGHRPVVFCQPGSRPAAAARERGFEIAAVRMRNDLDLGAAFGLARAFRRARLDLVHLHTGRANWLGGLAARLARLPAVTTRRMDRRVRPGLRTDLVYRRLTRRAVAISPAVADCLRAGGVPASRVELIYEAVDPERVRPRAGRAATRAALGVAESDLVLLCLAALIRRKGIDALLEALAVLARGGRRPTLWLAGEGEERAALEAEARRLGLGERAHFLGRRDDTGDLLAACDVFVLPSRREGLGVAALEAMAAGRAVVCSAVGGLADSVVDGRTGLHVQPEDVEGLAAALAQLLDDGDLRARLGRSGPARIAERFSAEPMVEAHERLYREVIEEWHASNR
jgi:glycosyltransferase involved in cell wall biosynthesis